MIRVARIVGESFNLETKEEMPKAIILTNGFREYQLFIDDEIARDIIQMMMEVESHQKVNGKISTPVQPPRAEFVLGDPTPIPVVDPPAIQRGGAAAPKTKPPAMATIGVPEETPEASPEFEPGEEYDDPATGAASL